MHLSLPSILPCPVPGLCDFHASLFSPPDQSNEVPKEWYCSYCKEAHPTALTVGAKSPNREIASDHGGNLLELLPTEILVHISSYLRPDAQALLALTSRTICAKVGTYSWKYMQSPKDNTGYRERLDFLSNLSRDLPTFAICSSCNILRPYDSAFAWPLLRNHRQRRKASYPIYMLSDFLVQKVADAPHSTMMPLCPSLLACSGTYRKRWTTQERQLAQDAGFKEQDIQLGLAINFAATPRVSKQVGLICHIKYHITLPRPWSQLQVPERFAILRDIYLCPHMYASKLQPRDPSDPTYPSVSSIAPWLPDNKPIPKFSTSCHHCPTEFQSFFTSGLDLEPLVQLDVWRHMTESCSDGCSDAGHCEYKSRPRRIKVLYEATPAIEGFQE